MNNSKHNENKTIKIFEAFAGIGSQYKALKNISIKKGWNVKSVGIIEWFIPAIISYQSIHYEQKNIKKESFNSNVSLSNDSKNSLSEAWKNKNLNKSILGYWLNQSKNIGNNLFDITQVSGKQIPNDIDIFTYSFPCQDISNQGKQKGFSKDSKTRSGLLWEIERIFIEMKENSLIFPKYLLLENVKSIINKKNINTFNKWLMRLEDFGYESKWYLLNSANFGSAQNRERVFAISILKEHKEKVNFKFPKLDQVIKQKKPIKNILLNTKKYNSFFNKYSLNFKENKFNNVKKIELLNYTKFQSENYLYDINFSGPTLTASGAMSRLKLYFGKNKIRTMTPEECFRYMGFDSIDYLKIKKTKLVSPTKQIYLCGNSISIEILEAIFERMKF